MAPKRDRKAPGSPRSGPKGQGNSSPARGPAGSPQSKAVSDTGQGEAAGRPGFAAPRLGAKPRAAARSAARQQAIPDAVANRMARRIAIATGIPTLMGMGVFVGSYLLVSRGILDIAPAATLTASGGCFLLGLVGLSYGVLSSSWEDAPGSLLGVEQIGLNIGRLRESIRAMRQPGTGGPQG